ncbi:hypothetical protein [Scytonema hofmannii]|uniref:hypothetical protein n=1 Tax=Scytonema hofmannii TaxID=34078 RepID=UPI001313FF60|nr:hypothetical protein [Scytonema hofmannii]
MCDVENAIALGASRTRLIAKRKLKERLSPLAQAVPGLSLQLMPFWILDFRFWYR